MFTLVQHVITQTLHGLSMPNFFQGLCTTVAHTSRFHFSMAAGIGLTSGVGMDVNPRVNAECFAFFQQKLFTVCELNWAHQVGRIILIGHDTNWLGCGGW